MYELLVSSLALLVLAGSVVFCSAMLDLRFLRIPTTILSYLINQYLLFRYPIVTYEKARKRTIPTCPYNWPNGQGDVAKFLEGERNSSEWAHKFGRVYRIWSGMNPEVVLTDPIDVQTVFIDSDVHSKAVNNDDGWLMGQLLGKCVGLVSGGEWQRIRGSVNSAFSHKQTGMSTSRMIDLTSEYFGDLRTRGNLSRGLLYPARDLHMLPFWILADYIYGPLLTPESRAQLESMIPLRETLFGKVIRGGVSRFQWSSYIPNQANRDLAEFKSRWRDFNNEAYENCKDRQHQGLPLALLYDSVNQGAIDEDHALHTLDEMLFGNLDVTVGGLSWNPIFLAANPSVQADLRMEIRQAQSDQESWMSYLGSNSTLLAASILESARLKPLAAFSIPQAAPTDRTVGSFVVPAGTNFVVDTHALNIRNPFWGDDRTEYRPSRFMDSKPSARRYQYWRFGFGPRLCMGRYVADLLLRVLIGHLVDNYEVSLDSENVWDKDPLNWILQPTTSVKCCKIEDGGLQDPSIAEA